MRISERGQITIPKHLRERFGMNHNVEVEITPTEKGLLLRKRADRTNIPWTESQGYSTRTLSAKALALTTTSAEVQGKGKVITSVDTNVLVGCAAITMTDSRHHSRST